MTQLQRKICIGGLVIIIVMCMFPPWLNTFTHGVYHEKPAGYSFIASPQAPSFGNGLKIDMSRLSVQCVSVLALTAAIFLMAAVGQNAKASRKI